MSRQRVIWLMGIAATLACAVLGRDQPVSVDQLRHTFLNPPDDARIMMRWWWFGPAVTKPELERELRVMKAAGIGGVEIQPVYPLELNDPQKHFRNLPYLSDDFMEVLRFAATTAQQMGMRVDMTLGSGWPYGGPSTPITEAAGRLRCDRTVVPAGTQTVAVPAMENGEKLISVVVANGVGQQFADAEMQPVTTFRNGRVELPAGGGPQRTVLFFISSRTGQQVKRAGVGAEGYVLDHYDRTAVEHHLLSVGDRLMQAFSSKPPYAVFSDSLEVFGSDWTPNFLEEFEKRRGYDLTPYLPALAGDMGDKTLAIRHDWGKTLTELANENYLVTVREWAHQHHTLFRSQTYGIPPVVLSSNTLVDLPEGESGSLWRAFGPCRWAASASHLYGKPVTSSETWTWLHSPAFRATPLDVKADADLHFLQGINQLVGHGWPYSPPSAGEPGWKFYASAALNDHNPWFEVMPEVNRYLQRVSWLLRQGQPANDIAVYLPIDDAWAGFTLGKTSVDREMEQLIGPVLGPQILNAGYNFDFIDDGAIGAVGIPYRVIILPGVERIPVATLQKISDYVQRGGFAIATRRLPSLAPGFAERERETPQIEALVHAIFDGSKPKARFVLNEQDVSATLVSMLTPDFATGQAGPQIGFVHRKLSNAEIYFVANTSNQPVDTDAHVRCTWAGGEWWNPVTGEIAKAELTSGAQSSVVGLKLAPYESRILVLSPSQANLPEPQVENDVETIELSSDWKVSFPNLNHAVEMPSLRSWTDDEATRYYSGRAIYQKVLQVADASFSRAAHWFLDFGAGIPVEHTENIPLRPLPGTASPAVERAAELGITSGPGTRAWLESPVREAAAVYVNGKRAGAVWCPPYRLEISALLHPGPNTLRIEVGNLAINEMAGQSPPEYRLLNLLYGERFTAQDMKNLAPLPSGLLGKVQLVGSKSRK